MKHKIYEFSLLLKILYFVFKESLNIPEYRCLLIGRVLQLYKISHLLAYEQSVLVCVIKLTMFV